MRSTAYMETTVPFGGLDGLRWPSFHRSLVSTQLHSSICKSFYSLSVLGHSARLCPIFQSWPSILAALPLAPQRQAT